MVMISDAFGVSVVVNVVRRWVFHACTLTLAFLVATDKEGVPLALPLWACACCGVWLYRGPRGHVS